MGRKPRQPSEFELQILGVLWQDGPCTVRQVLDRLPDGKKRAYTSVLSVMQVMDKKGLVAHERVSDALAHVYQPAVTRRNVMGPMLQKLVTRVFGGSPSAAVQQLLLGTDVSDEELEQIRQLLDELKQKNRGAGNGASP